MIPQPSSAPGEHPGGRQDICRSELRSKLADDEKRLRELVATYELDPKTIDDNSLNSVTEVIKRIFLVLRADAADPNGVLPQMASIWESLKNGYEQASDAASEFEPMLERFKDIKLESKPAPGTLGAATRRMVKLRREWLTKVGDFQEAVSSFYDELAPGEKRID